MDRGLEIECLASVIAQVLGGLGGDGGALEFYPDDAAIMSANAGDGAKAK